MSESFAKGMRFNMDVLGKHANYLITTTGTTNTFMVSSSKAKIIPKRSVKSFLFIFKKCAIPNLFLYFFSVSLL